MRYSLVLMVSLALLLSVVISIQPYEEEQQPTGKPSFYINTVENKQIYTERILVSHMKQNKSQKIELNTFLTNDEAYKYLYEAFARYPEIFLSYSPRTSVLKYSEFSNYCKGYSVTYISDRSGKLRFDEVNEKVNRIVYYANQKQSDKEKVDYVLNWFEENSKYTDTPGNMWDASLYGCLVNGKATCVGFSEAFQMIMNRLEIPCEIVVSTERKHAWNQININNNKQKIDVTSIVH